jgi:hypothetical protein
MSVNVSTTKEAIMFKKTIVILACGALIAPVAFAQTRSTDKKQTTAATEQSITVTGTIIKMTTGEGSAANYQPFKTLGAAMFSTDLVRLWTRTAKWSKPRSNPARTCVFIT